MKSETIRWIASMAVAAVVAYFSAQAGIQERVTRLETRMDNMTDVVKEVRTDVKALLERR